MDVIPIIILGAAGIGLCIGVGALLVAKYIVWYVGNLED